MRLPTVLIETDAGPVLINECDFDEKNHKLCQEKPEKKPAKKPAAKKPAAKKA